MIFSRKRADAGAARPVTSGPPRSSTRAMRRRRWSAARTTSPRATTTCSGSTWAACTSRRSPTSRCGCRPTRRAWSSRSCWCTATTRSSSASSPPPAPRASGTRCARRSGSRCSATARARRRSQGEYGTELHAQVNTPDGPTDLRFVGIDGPRWMVRGVFQGPVATDPAVAGPLVECLDGLVVDRGPGGEAGPRAAAAAAAPGDRRPGRGRRRATPPPRRARSDPRAPARRDQPRRRTLAARFRRRRGRPADGERGEGDAEVMTTDEGRVSLRRILQTVHRQRGRDRRAGAAAGERPVRRDPGRAVLPGSAGLGRRSAAHGGLHAAHQPADPGGRPVRRQ